jgi:hypothetical protein
MPDDLIDRFRKQVAQIVQMLRYLLLMQETFPHVMVQLDKDQTKKLEPVIDRWIDFCREIYEMPDLGSNPPRPLPVDPNCPPHLLSDHTRERLGRNAPFFDFVNAPFTYPIGTQISVTCITSAWNANDTFVNASISELQKKFPNDPRVRLLNERLEKATGWRGAWARLWLIWQRWTCSRADRQRVKGNVTRTLDADRLSTDEKLRILEIAWAQEDYAKYLDENRPFRADQVELLVQAGKDIRTSFTHRFGEPTDRLKRMMRDELFETLGFRIVNTEFEVTLWGARKMLEAIELRAVIVDQKKSLWPYTRSKPTK